MREEVAEGSDNEAFAVSEGVVVKMVPLQVSFVPVGSSALIFIFVLCYAVGFVGAPSSSEALGIRCPPPITARQHALLPLPLL